jgi:hypothetical protein
MTTEEATRAARERAGEIIGRTLEPFKFTPMGMVAQIFNPDLWKWLDEEAARSNRAAREQQARALKEEEAWIQAWKERNPEGFQRQLESRAAEEARAKERLDWFSSLPGETWTWIQQQAEKAFAPPEIDEARQAEVAAAREFLMSRAEQAQQKRAEQLAALEAERAPIREQRAMERELARQQMAEQVAARNAEREAQRERSRQLMLPENRAALEAERERLAREQSAELRRSVGELWNQGMELAGRFSLPGAVWTWIQQQAANAANNPLDSFAQQMPQPMSLPTPAPQPMALPAPAATRLPAPQPVALPTPAMAPAIPMNPAASLSEADYAEWLRSQLMGL